VLRDRIAKRYAKSFFDLALELDQLEPARTDIELLDKTIGQVRELELMLKSQIIRQYLKVRIFHSIFDGKLNPITTKFMDLLMAHGREELVPEITDEFLDIYNRHHNRTVVQVLSATPLTDELRTQVENLVKTQLNTSPILKEKVDPDLIGGIVLQIDTKRYDASVANSLRLMRKQLLATA
jgi:F-type H+-transporting ATPase subunit delta